MDFNHLGTSYKTLSGFSSGLSSDLALLALDPGGTTGVCALVDGKLHVAQLGPNEHHDVLYKLITSRISILPYAQRWTAIVYESFQYRNSLSKADLIPVEYIGVIKAATLDPSLRVIIPTHTQTTSQKDFFDNDKLKALGLYTPGLKHANDAVRHMLYHLVVTLKQESILNKLKRDDGY